MKNIQQNIINLHTKLVESEYKDANILNGLINETYNLLNKLKINEDIQQEVVIKLINNWIYKKIEHGDFYKYLSHKIKFFIKDYKRDNLNFTGLSAMEKRKISKLYHTDNCEQEYNNLKSKVVNFEPLEYENHIEFNYTIFDECREILCDEDYNIIEMFYLKKLSQSEISKILNVSQKTVSNRINEILEKIRKEVLKGS